jgi:hypothetical protein
MKTKDRLVAQLHRMADMLLPFTAGLSAWDGHDLAADADMEIADPAARQWHGMMTVAAAMVDRQNCSLSDSQLVYLQRTFVGGPGSFQDFRLYGEQADVNRGFDMERHALLELLADCHSESVHASQERA